MPTAEPGYTTTEFWLATTSATVTEVFAAVVAFGGHATPDQQAAVIGLAQGAVGLIAAGYALARSWRKRGTA